MDLIRQRRHERRSETTACRGGGQASAWREKRLLGPIEPIYSMELGFRVSGVTDRTDEGHPESAR